LPVLIYCIGALNLPVAIKIKDLGVSWNDCFHKLFGYKRFESVIEVQYFCGELSFDLIYELQRWKFLSAANKFCGRFSCLYNLQSHTVSELKTKFGVNDSVGRMKQLVHIYFGRLFKYCVVLNFCILVFLLYRLVCLSVRCCRFLFVVFIIFYSIFVFVFCLSGE